MYNVKSLKAEEFISDEEIKETLEYAEANKNNIGLIDAIIEKAKLKKGLTHREASVLLACEIPEKLDEVYKLAQQIKKDFYGNRIVLFAPLYLSNYCVNGCVYCPYHMKNKHIARKKLTQEEIVKEVTALQDMGHKRLAIEAGEDPVNNPIEYGGPQVLIHRRHRGPVARAYVCSDLRAAWCFRARNIPAKERVAQ